jgi:hypothetical protein
VKAKRRGTRMMRLFKDLSSEELIMLPVTVTLLLMPFDFFTLNQTLNWIVTENELLYPNKLD